MTRPRGGDIVVVDCRPAVILDNELLFADEYESVFVAPITSDPRRVRVSFAVALEPSEQNHCRVRSWVLANYAMAISLSRTRATRASITQEQLQLVRQRVAYMIGFPQVSPLLASFLDSRTA